MDETKMEVTNPEVTEEVASTETTESTKDTEETVDWKAEALKQKQLAENQKIRAEKAEKLAKSTKGEDPKTVRSNELSSMDVMALMKADVAEEDISEVTDYAKYKGISVKEALGTSTIKATLAERQEQRKSASVANTGSGRRSSTVVSDDSILSSARSGKMPEGDAEIARLIAARWKQK